MKSNLSISIHSLSNFKNGVNIVKIFFNFYYFRKRKHKASNFIFEAELVGNKIILPSPLVGGAMHVGTTYVVNWSASLFRLQGCIETTSSASKWDYKCYARRKVTKLFYFNPRP